MIVASGPGLRAKLEQPDFVASVELDPSRQLVGSMCSGALLLAAKGLLRGQRATTYPTQRARLASMGVEVVEEAFVRSGNVATAAGCLASLDLAWTYVEVDRTVGEAKAVQFERIVNEITTALDPQFLCVPRDGAASRFLPVKDVPELERRRPEIEQALRARGILA